jgi:hypothetical protein
MTSGFSIMLCCGIGLIIQLQRNMPVLKEHPKRLGNSWETIQSRDPKGITNGLGGFAGFKRAKTKEVTKYHVIISQRPDTQSLGLKKVQLYIQRWTTGLNLSPSQINKMCAYKNVSNTEIKFYDIEMKTVTNQNNKMHNFKCFNS